MAQCVCRPAPTSWISCDCPQTVLFEAIQSALSGKRILNDYERRRDRDFGQGGFLSKRRDRNPQSSQTEIGGDNPCYQHLSAITATLAPSILECNKGFRRENL